MKKLFFIAILATLCFYLGCNKAEYQETSPKTPTTEVSDDAVPNPNVDPNGPVGTRSCGAITECEITMVTDTDCTLEICGDVPIGTGTCNYMDCNGDPSFTAGWQAGIGRSFCVSGGGNFCLENTCGGTIVVSINGGAGVSVPNNGIQCWRLGSGCSVNLGC